MVRRIKNSEEDIPVPPLVQSALLWGMFIVPFQIVAAKFIQMRRL